MFNIECHSGKGICQHSFFSTEEEILLLAARQFRVGGSLDSGNGLHIIQLEEIDLPFPLLEPVRALESVLTYKVERRFDDTIFRSMTT